MRWSERQRAMLREMGIPPFWPETPDEAPAAAPVQDAMPASFAQSAAAMSDAPMAPMAPMRVADAIDAAGLTAPARVVASVSVAPPAASPRGAASRSPMAADAASTDDKVRPARPAGIESMDWPALRQAVVGCQACALCDSRRQTVFGVGNIEADWMIVGEAPGEQEDLRGEPFVGRAGQLLDRMLESLDLTRSEAPSVRQVYIANVLKCRPPANRNPLPQEVAQCEPYLLRQMALVQPKVILAMGRFAVQSLLKTNEAIGRLRGRVHQIQGIPVVVTYHPAYLLRNPADKALVWDDLCLAREVWAQCPR